MVNGNDLRLRIGDDLVIGEVTSSVTLTNDLIEVVESDVGSSTQVASGKSSGSFSFDSIYYSDQIEIGDEFNVRIGTETDGLEGDVVVESVSTDAGSDDLVRHSGVMRVTGGLRRYHEDFFLQRENDCFILLEDGCKIVLE